MRFCRYGIQREKMSVPTIPNLLISIVERRRCSATQRWKENLAICRGCHTKWNHGTVLFLWEFKDCQVVDKFTILFWFERIISWLPVGASTPCKILWRCFITRTWFEEGKCRIPSKINSLSLESYENQLRKLNSRHADYIEVVRWISQPRIIAHEDVFFSPLPTE